LPLQVRLAPREREILRLWLAGNSAKDIAFALELAKSTVNGRLLGLARKMGIGRREIKTWMWQHPTSLERGSASERGLHPAACRCRAPYCLLMLHPAAEHPAGCRCSACLRPQQTSTEHPAGCRCGACLNAAKSRKN
jgi:DNA-binding CsgD family transcriptional regulator